VSNRFLQELDSNIQLVREAAYGVLEKIQAKRKKEVSNAYQVGDFVLVDAKGMDWKRSKLAPRFFGPFVVEKVHKADVTLRHLVVHDVKVVHMEYLKPFFLDSYEEAYKAALVDYSQEVIDRVVTWAGDPEIRSNMSFLVRFLDGEELWLPWGKDLCESEPFRRFCEGNAPLLPLLVSEREWRLSCSRLDKSAIEGIRLGTECFVDLRAWGWSWFHSLGLPDMEEKVYVVSCKFLKWESRTRTRVLVSCPLFDQEFVWKNSDVMRYGLVSTLTDSMVLVDTEFCIVFPQVLKGG
jgi:hypothetical protein